MKHSVKLFMLVSLFAVSNGALGFENTNIFDFDRGDALAAGKLVIGFAIPTALSFLGNLVTENIDNEYSTTAINAIKEHPMTSALSVFALSSIFTACLIFKEYKKNNDMSNDLSKMDTASDKFCQFSTAFNNKQLLAAFTNFIDYSSINYLALGALVRVTNFALWKIRKG